MTLLERPTEAEARAALIALGLDETRYSFYHKAFGGWTWQALSALNRRHRGRYRTKRLAKKAHPGWTPEEKRMLRFYQYGRGEWSWRPRQRHNASYHIAGRIPWARSSTPRPPPYPTP